MFTCITTLINQGTASGKQGNQSRCGSGSVHLNAKILACQACNRNHVLMKCQNFERKTFDECVQIMRKAQLCHNCFQYGHISRGCLTMGACQVDGCKQMHYTLLHPPYQQGLNVNQASEEHHSGHLDTTDFTRCSSYSSCLSPPYPRWTIEHYPSRKW